MYLDDGFSSLDVRKTYHDLTVESARSQKCRVQNVRSVGGSDDDDAGVLLESVHLNQELVQGLLSLVVAAADTGTSLTSHCVDLVDEYDTGCVLLGVVEKVSDTGSSHTYEHLNEVRTGYGKEGHVGLAGRRP